MKLSGIRAVLGAIALALALAAPAGSGDDHRVRSRIGDGARRSRPRYIHPGPEGNLWFTDSGTKPGFGRIGTTGERLPWIDLSSGPQDFVFTPDRIMYFTGGVRWGRATDSEVCRFEDDAFGAMQECAGPAHPGRVNGLAYAADGTHFALLRALSGSTRSAS